MHMYKWKALLALIIVNVAFFNLHGYYNYEFLVFFWPFVTPFYKLSKSFLQTHKFGGSGWFGNFNFF
jgi:hypothetical protein